MSWTLRLLTPALLLGLACTPKDDESDDDAGDTTSAEGTFGGSSTSGDEATTGIGDPTVPGTASATTAGTASGGSDGTTTTSPGTSVGTLDEGGEVTSAGTVPGTTDDPSDTATDTNGETGPDVPPPACEGDAAPIVANTIVAYTEAQVPPQPGTTSGGSSSTGGDPNPPDTIYVRLSDQDFMCKDPSAILECGPHWEVTIVIKPEFQFPGTYDLLDTDKVFATSWETAAPEGMGPDECSQGGGSFGGTFELIAITDGAVEGRLCNVDPLFFDNDPELNGSFVAERCQ